ncbi:ABC transporter [Oleiphilus sp. HI0130]|nr:ABC transporter [Oleiphilus sp. HI0118]KZZ41424.1 ABC transporter [Oleiphilus sp. HI0118]KZZ71288.1 ABC transporter [Oleiphilus sp. HI0130]
MKLSKIKTGSFERRLSLTRAGLVAGTRMAGSLTAGLFKGAEGRKEARRQALSREAKYLADELGKLKGSVVKIGQMMALYGEHFLPVEVTEALHTLEENTQPLEWAIVRGILFEQLGSDAVQDLDIEETPIGTASLGQVHRARIKGSGQEICLKIQYPGVASAIDADLDSVAQILRLTNVVARGPAFDEWLLEVREMMHREVDYVLEAETTQRFHELLKDDSRYIVPSVIQQYSNSHILATSYEKGVHVGSELAQALPQEQRDKLSASFLELFLNELFVWHEIQTDPNFGNYRIRIDENDVRLVLLDFGAVQRYQSSFIQPVCSMIRSAYHRDLEGVIAGGISLNFMRPEWPREVLEQFGNVCMAVLEPLVPVASQGIDKAQYCDAQGRYLWNESDLPTRIAKIAARSAVSRYFKIPPKEFVFLNRKLVGVYTFISVLRARFDGEPILREYLEIPMQ